MIVGVCVFADTIEKDYTRQVLLSLLLSLCIFIHFFMLSLSALSQLVRLVHYVNGLKDSFSIFSLLL